MLMVAVACPKCVNNIMKEKAIKNIKLKGVIWNQNLFRNGEEHG
jgi:ribosomal protein S26